MSRDHIDVWRMSASRPWQLEKTSPVLSKHLKFSGDLNYHLIESVLVEDLSNACVDYAKSIGYKTHIINPAQGQGYAMDYALKKVITSKYALKWEDDFMPEMDIPLDTCVALMEKYPHINQICFNKRETMKAKRCAAERKYVEELGYDIDKNDLNKTGNVRFWWPKEQRYFELNGHDNPVPLVVKEKWWFGTSLWRTDYIRSKFKYWDSNTHNLMNDVVLLPLAGYRSGTQINGKTLGKVIPTPKQVEDNIGCYIYGKTGDPRMVFHAGLNDSLWNGELQNRWEKEGRKIIGV